MVSVLLNIAENTSAELTSSSPSDTGEVTDEDGESNSDRRKEGSLGLLGCQHEDGEDQQGGGEEFDAESLSGRNAGREGVDDSESANSESISCCCCCDTSDELSDGDSNGSASGEVADEPEGECDCRVESGSSDTEESPGDDDQ